MDITLDELVNSQGSKAERMIMNPDAPGRKNGSLVMYVEEVVRLNFTVHFKLAGIKLDKKDLFGKSGKHKARAQR